MIILFIFLPLLVLACSVVSVLVSSHFIGYNQTAAVGILSMAELVIFTLSGIAIGWSHARNIYIEALQDFYNKMRDVPERARGITTKEERENLFSSAVFDLPHPIWPIPESEWQGRKNLHKSTIRSGGGGEEEE